MRFRPALAFSIMLSLGIAGCGGDDAPPPASFPPLHYDYLTKLRLNVGSIDIQDHSVPLGPDDISAQSPVTPAQALLQIAHDRLFAAGLLGSAQFVIDQASIVRGAAGRILRPDGGASGGDDGRRPARGLRRSAGGAAASAWLRSRKYAGRAVWT